MVNESYKVLIVGNGAVCSALVRKLKSESVKIYATCDITSSEDLYQPVDIRENDLTGLLMFALENDINLTISVSEMALGEDIVSFFQSNGQNIFGPSKESCGFILNKVLCKKLLYKMHAQIPKFAVFNKPNQIADYLNNASFPVILRTPENSGLSDDKMICTGIKSAANFYESLFLQGQSDILIEDYVFGHNFTIYYVTDGYSAIELSTVGNYKFLDGENKGLYNDCTGCYCPDYKISDTVKFRLSSIIHNILGYLDNGNCPYTGIIGLECTLTGEDKFVINDVKPFLQNNDARAILSLCEDDLIKIFSSCINGFFSDEYESIKTNDYSAVSLGVYSEKENERLNISDYSEQIDLIKVKNIDGEYFSTVGMNYIVTSLSATLGRAKYNLSESLQDQMFDGMKYRKDICDKINR